MKDTISRARGSKKNSTQFVFYFSRDYLARPRPMPILQVRAAYVSVYTKCLTTRSKLKFHHGDLGSGVQKIIPEVLQ